MRVLEVQGTIAKSSTRSPVLVAVEHAVWLAYDDRVKELLAEDYFLSVKTSDRLSASPSSSLPASRVMISSSFSSRVPAGTTPVR